MNELKQLFDDIGVQAKSYQVADRAWSAARRRRYLVRAAPVAVAAMVVVIAVAATVLPFRADDRRPQVTPAEIPTHPADRQAEHGSLDWLPGRLSYPATAPEVLPRDRGVGPGAMVFGGERRGAEAKILVTSAGAMYQIPLTGDPDVSLSPDGRWLAASQPDRGALVLRDLTGTAEHRFPGIDWKVRAWSHDGRYAVIAGDSRVVAPLRVDLTTGEQRAVRGGTARWNAVGLLPSGEVFFVDVPGQPSPGAATSGRDRVERFAWHAVDPATGQRRSGEIDAVGAVAATESLMTNTAVLDPAGRTLLVPVWGGGPLTTALLAIDLTAGRPAARYNLNPGGAEAGAFVLAAYRAEGIIVYRYTEQKQEVHVVDPATGQRTTVCESPVVGIWTRT